MCYLRFSFRVELDSSPTRDILYQLDIHGNVDFETLIRSVKELLTNAPCGLLYNHTAMPIRRVLVS